MPERSLSPVAATVARKKPAPSRRAAVAKPARKAAAAPAAPVAPPTPARPAQAVKASPAPKAGKAAKPAKPARADKPAKAPKAALVRDSFTMPHQDFRLIASLKDRALGEKRPAKKSELLRAGLHVLEGLSAAALVAVLNKLMPLKPGRPKKSR